MTAGLARLAPAERRAFLYGPLYRVIGTPVVAALSLINTAVIVRETGEAVYGLVALISTLTLLFPFADLGIGATVLSASAQLTGPGRDPAAVDVIRRAYHVLCSVAAVIVVAALGVMAVNGWAYLVGFASGPSDRWAITVAACVFALTIPTGLGVRILIGIDRNPLATLIFMSCPVFALAFTALLYVIDADGIWYAVSGLGGVVIGQAIGTALALRITGLGRSAFARVTPSATRRRLLAGSMWLFAVGVGLAAGTQSGRLVLAHLSTPVELSGYALMAQFYAICWQVVSTAALAYWPVFVKRRAATEETVRLWWRLTAALAGCAIVAMVCMASFGPWAAKVLSGGRIDVSPWLAMAFGVILLGQAIHLPTFVLLTRPDEARWQARWTMAMAVVSVAVGCLVAYHFGAVGVACAAALGIFAAQVLPDLLWVPRLVRQRSGVVL
jgi:O-antigen/teichoic acid export membrane protein